MDDGAVLMNLLPGLRELRTPLATGYVWLVTLWFGLHDLVPSRKHSSGLVLATYQLVEFMGKPALLAALSFIAFLIGMARLEPDTLRAGIVRIAGIERTRLILRRAPRGSWNGKVPAISQGSVESLWLLIDEIAREADIDAWRGMQIDPRIGEETLDGVTRDLRSLAIRLQVDKPDLYQEYDRKAAEGDFRVNVGIAVGGLSVTLAATGGSVWFLLGLIVALLMVRSGIYRQQTANDVLIETLTSRIVMCPALNKFDANLRKAATSPNSFEPPESEPVPASG